MPSPAIPEETLLATVEAWRVTGQSVRHGAEWFAEHHGPVQYNTFASRLRIAKSRGLHLSPGARTVVDRAQLAYPEAKGGWIHNYDDDGKKVGTTRWSAPQDGPTEEDVLARIAAAFSDIPTAPPVLAPEHPAEDLCVLWPLYDVHWGMHAWGLETGGPDYDLKLAAQDLRGAFDRVLALVPACAEAVLLLGGDFFHGNDNTNQTPANRHNLDVDGRIYKTIDTAIQAIDYAIQQVQAKAAKVTVRVLRGNHDEDSHRYLTFALAERFRGSRVTVLKDPRDLFMFQWGRTSIFGHHGDRMKPEEFVMRMADVCPFWSATRHRYAYTGHKHSLAARRIGGVHWEQLDAFCPPDAYGSTWTSRRAFKAEVFHKHSGRVLSAHDPLERDE
jgi:hypothetical protein